MNILALALVSMLLAGDSPTQQSAQQAEAVHGLVVVKKSWRKTVFRPGWDRPFEDLQRASPQRSIPSSAEALRDLQIARQRMARRREGYRYSATFKNTGNKTIRVIVWEYVFTDPATQETSEHQFRSRVKLKPGKKAELSRFITAPPTRTVNATSAGKAPAEDVIITYIEYDDRTNWQRPVKEAPASAAGN